jgi:ATP-dependent helicase/nuclease subunit A
MDQLSLFGGAPATPVGPRLPDQDARDRIQHDLDINLLVEAGAGAGKTSEMVRRMVALVRTGVARVDEVAAVTFTRKAAAELRERFQTALETELRSALAAGDTAAAARLDAALRGIDQSFLGTIHAFCARLLRERPLDAGLDPAFRETLGAEEARLRRRFWHGYIERATLEARPELAELAAMGLAPQQLAGLFEVLAAQPDVEYPARPEPRPDASALRRRIESIMDSAVTHVPRDEPRGGWDRLQATLRMMRFHRFVLGWADDVRFLDVIAELQPSSFSAKRIRWEDGDAAKRLERELAELFDEGGAATALVRRWWAHRYPAAITFARRAAQAYEAERVRKGTLNFQDLLMFAARLLRNSPAARRELSDHYRFLLVDEFQDTDPIQAEVLFLLASDEELDLFGTDAGDATAPGAEAAFASWRHLTPRPGALFVVGDPKQSIYRFRRADMTLYQQVKRRFTSFGAVIELTSNFRSRSGIGRFVNETFAGRFPAESTDVQARFAPMLVQVAGAAESGAEPGAGVYWYELDDPVHGRVPQLARQDADRIATWIAERVRAGDRAPGEFLLLTANTKWLARYAAALEARNVPVQVTGAGVGGPDSIELDELRLLLRALHDPGDASLAVAVLVGLFFGLDYEQFTAHTERWSPHGQPQVRTPFSFTAPWPDAATEVERALGTLHAFWLVTRRQPSDVAVPEIVERLGILPFAAAGELGATRAGALLFALDTVRAAALAGDASLAGAIAALDSALDEGDSEAPLEPGRGGAVRVMNLHKAKGLEANVVILATPFGDWSPMPEARVVREATGRALGHATVSERKGAGRTVTLARPHDWPEHEEEERRFTLAEEQRLLYVAATRAAHELVVGCAYSARSPSRWRSFYPWLHHEAARLELPQPARPPRQELHATPAQVLAAAGHAAAARAAHGRPGYRAAPVSERKAEVSPLPDAAAPQPPGPGQTRGTDWGSAVHDALHYAAQGMGADALREACRNRLVMLDRPLDATGEPDELAELLAVVASVLDSPLWRRAQAADRMLVEVAFAVPFSAAEYATLAGRPAPIPGDAPIPSDAALAGGADGPAASAGPLLEIVDGRIDLAFREADGWVIVDYKSDAAGAGVDAGLLRSYRAQLSLYAMAWRRATGEPVAETALLFTATGDIVPVAV